MKIQRVLPHEGGKYYRIIDPDGRQEHIRNHHWHNAIEKSGLQNYIDNFGFHGMEITFHEGSDDEAIKMTHTRAKICYECGNAWKIGIKVNTDPFPLIVVDQYGTKRYWCSTHQKEYLEND